MVDKPAGLTSHDVVARARRQLGTRRVGHAGTLDPMATGVLVLGVDGATRLLGHLALNDKCYDATIRLGSATVTDDALGAILTRASAASISEVHESAITRGLSTLTGTVLQRPSSVSAIKVDGKRAYARVRAGEEIVLPAREVDIMEIAVNGICRIENGIDIDVRVTCSSGTYIRAIARDLGDHLGVGGHLTALRRTRVGAFGVAESVDVDHIAQGFQTLDSVAARSFRTIVVDDVVEQDIRHGRPVAWPMSGAPGSESVIVHAFMSESGALLALGERSDSRLRYLAVFAHG